jgi:hypothetical protein
MSSLSFDVQVRDVVYRYLDYHPNIAILKFKDVRTFVEKSLNLENESCKSGSRRYLLELCIASYIKMKGLDITQPPPPSTVQPVVMTIPPSIIPLPPPPMTILPVAQPSSERIKPVSLVSRPTSKTTQSSSIATQSSTFHTQSSSIVTQSSTFTTQSSSTFPTQSSSIVTQSSTFPTQSSSIPTQSSTFPTAQLPQLIPQSTSILSAEIELHPRALLGVFRKSRSKTAIATHQPSTTSSSQNTLSLPQPAASADSSSQPTKSPTANKRTEITTARSKTSMREFPPTLNELMRTAVFEFLNQFTDVNKLKFREVREHVEKELKLEKDSCKSGRIKLILVRFKSFIHV